nr:TIGR01906 family membrane protein [Maliibacterium massiliense]
MEQRKGARRIWGGVAAGVASVCLLVILLLDAVAIVAFSKAHYARQYSQLGVAQTLGTPPQVGMREEDLMQVTDHLIEYLKGNRENLDMQARIGGVTREVFTTLEKEHMVDVQALFAAGFALRNILRVVLAASLIALFALRGRRGFATLAFALLVALAALLVALGVLVVAALVDFNGLFVKFHELFFTNDKWILDPNVHVLIQMVPEAFFYNTAMAIALWCGGFWLGAAALAIAVLVCARRARRREVRA